MSYLAFFNSIFSSGRFAHAAAIANRRLPTVCLALLLLPVIGANTSPQAQNVPSDVNLVYNHSFEDYIECPKKIDAKGVLTTVEAWYQPTAGSADYFNRCSARDCAVPQNKLGYQLPHSGDGYCGIYCSKDEYREYLQTQLREPLCPGCRYRVSFHVSLSENSTSAVSSIGALFTAERIADSGRGIFLQKSHLSLGTLVSQTISTNYAPQVVSNHTLDDTAGWMEISGEFVASGGEEFLTIGNFNNASHSGIEDYPWLGHLLTGSYYYVDDVSVTLVSRAKKTNDTSTHNAANSTNNRYGSTSFSTLSVGSTVILHNIYFQFDRSTILQQSYKELSSLIAMLHDNPKIRIEIGGHTDSQGSASYNLKLSENRAKSVAEYLTAKGIDPKRIQYRGYGKTKPIADNSTEEGQAKNRRVEIKILSK